MLLVLCLSESNRALLYNDISVLENHHAMTTFSVLREPQSNIFQNMQKNQPRATWTSMRTSIIEAVLATDMVS